MPNLTSSNVTYTSGTAQFRISTSSNASNIPAPAADMSQFWVALRILIPNANTSYTTGTPRLFTWATDTNEESYLAYSNALGAFNANREHLNSGGGNGAVVTTTWTANTHMTLVAAFESAQVKLSKDGAAFVTFANSMAPTSPPSTLVFNERGYSASDFFDMDVYWAAMGSGTLTDTDASTLNGFGDTNPSWGALPGSGVFLWTADSDTYQNAPAAGGTVKNLPLLGVG